MQFLVQGKDQSLTVIYKKSIIVENLDLSLSVGETVKFLWPEGSPKAKEFCGVIIAKDQDEEKLFNIMESIKKSWVVKKKGGGKKIDGVNNCDQVVADQIKETGEALIMGKKRKSPVTESEESIMNAVENKDLSDEGAPDRANDLPPGTVTAYDWLIDAINNIKAEVSLELDCMKAKILGKLDFVKTSLRSDVSFKEIGETITEKSDSRRSFGMTLDLEIPKTGFNENEPKSQLGFAFETESTTEFEVYTPSASKSLDDQANVNLTTKNKSQCSSKVVFEKNRNVDNIPEGENSESEVYNYKKIFHRDKRHNKLNSSSKHQPDIQPTKESSKKSKDAHSKTDIEIINIDSNSDEEQFFENTIAPKIKLEPWDDEYPVMDLNTRKSTTKRYYRIKEEEVSSDESEYLKLLHTHDMIGGGGDNGQVDISGPSTSSGFSPKKFKRPWGAINSSDEEQDTEIRGKSDKQPRNDDENADRDSGGVWTLRYPIQTDDVAELVKGSKIYVNIFAMKTMLEKSSSQTELSRALLYAVFTDEALKTCSLSGKKCSLKEKNSATVKPGLHKEAVDTIIVYVQEIAKKEQWPAKDIQTIRKSMSGKLFEIANSQVSHVSKPPSLCHRQ